MSSLYDWSKTPASNASSDSGLTYAEGQAPSTLNNAGRQVMGRVAEWRDDLGGVTTTGGTANAITVTANSAFATYANGIILTFKASSDNTGATTLNVNAIGAKSIRKMTQGGEIALTGGEILSGHLCMVAYNAAANSGAGGWMLQNPVMPSAANGLVNPTASGASTGYYATRTGTGASTLRATADGDVIRIGSASADNVEFIYNNTTIATLTSSSLQTGVRLDHRRFRLWRYRSRSANGFP